MKQVIKRLLLLVLVSVITYGVYVVAASYIEKKEIEAAIQILPNGQFTSLNNEVVALHDYKGMPVVIVYFHPECEHCHYEAQALRLNKDALLNTQLVMITHDDSLARVNQFVNQHQLYDLEFIDILLDKNDAFYNTFGTTTVPSVFIYDSKRQLQKKYLGETKPEAIIAALSQN